MNATSGDSDFRCAAASLLRNEALAGTASSVRAYLLLEHAGPWGENALRDSRMSEQLRTELRRRAAEAGVRVLLIRRPGRRASDKKATVFAAHAHPFRPWLERETVSDLAEVLDLDFHALRAGHPTELTSVEESVLCVCTHGRHDACCAEQGRPVASALASARPEETWEVSHIGGDRFAANLLVLPHGLYYGRLEPQSAVAVAGSHAAGELDLDHLRGRSGYSMPVQAAEIALRRDLGETREGALRLVTRHQTQADTVDDTADDRVDETEAVFAVGGAEYAVLVRSSRGADPQQLTCRATRDNPIPQHEVVTITRRSST